MTVPLLMIAGTFYRSIRADRVDRVLDPPGPNSAGRYHRHGQPALYLSPAVEWAYIATSGYWREDGIQRVVVPLALDSASVFDQRDLDACRSLGIDRERSNVAWRKALEDGVEPPSWQNADAARAAGADGIVDRSRHIPDGWHVTLFSWNTFGAPIVAIAGEPIVVELSSSKDHWG